MADWITPKTNWASSDAQGGDKVKIGLIDVDGHNFPNLALMKDVYGSEYDKDMGTDYVVGTDEDKMWSVDVFNAIEDNLDTINEHTFNFDFGLKTTFYANGVFIRYTELNRIESASLQLYEAIVNHVKTIPVLPFVLGQYRLLRA